METQLDHLRQTQQRTRVHERSSSASVELKSATDVCPAIVRRELFVAFF
jgi:hypothetical protein